MKNVRKALVAVGAACGVAAAALSDGKLDAAEIVAVALAFLGALGVYQIPNTPDA